jgi:hypothetical protein
VVSACAWLWAGSVDVRVTAGNAALTWPRGSDAAVASAIRCGVQWASAPRCAAALTWSLTAAEGPDALASSTLASSTLARAGCAVPPAPATPIVTAAAPTPTAASTPSTPSTPSTAALA